MSDNNIKIGLEIDDKNIDKAMGSLAEGNKKLESSGKGLEKSFENAFGDKSLRSITMMTQRLEKLSGLMDRISKQSAVFSQTVGQSGSGGIPIYDANGNIVKTVTPSGGGGSSGGGTGAGDSGSTGTPGGGKKAEEASGFDVQKILRSIGIASAPRAIAAALNTGASAYFSARDITRYNLPIAQKQNEMFGADNAMRGDISQLLAKERVQGDDDVQSQAKLKAYLPSIIKGAVGVGALIAAPFTGGLSLAAGGAAMAGWAGYDAMFKAPLRQQQNLKEYYGLELEKNPYAKRAYEFMPEYAAMVGNTEQQYGQESVASLMKNDPKYGLATRSRMLRLAREQGVRDPSFFSAETLSERSGLGSFVNAQARFAGRMPSGADELNLRSGMVSAGFGGRESIASREQLGELAGSTMGASGLTFSGDRGSTDYFNYVAGLGGTARQFGAVSAGAQRDTAQQAMSFQKAFTGNDLSQLVLREKLAAKGIMGFEATALINAGYFDNNKAEGRRALGKLGFSETEIEDTIETPSKVFGQASEGLLSKKFTEATGLTGGILMGGDLQGERAFRTAVQGPRTTGTGDFEQGAETRTQVINRAQGMEGAALVDSVQKAGDLFQSKITETAQSFANKIREEFDKLNARRPAAPTPSPNPNKKQ